MPPVTEKEVIAAVRFTKTYRAKFDITNAEFDQFQQIANLRALPPGAEFTIITHFEPGDGNEYQIWSLRLYLNKTETKSTYPQFGDIFRTHFIKVRRIDQGKIAWGPVAKNGLQAGVLFESGDRVYGLGSLAGKSQAGGTPNRGGGSGGMGMGSSNPSSKNVSFGTQITPRFYFRNTADTKQGIAFPNVMTRGYYKKLEAVDDMGNPLTMETDPDSAGPVGWRQMPFSFGAQHEIRGLPILLGDGARGDAETALRVAKGQTIRLRFTLDNYGDKEAEPLVTDWVELSVE